MSVGVLSIALSSIACEPKGGSKTPDAGGGDASSRGDWAKAGSSCASDPKVGHELVADYRGARAKGGELTAAREQLRSSCEAGCGPTCLEYAHTSADPREAASYWARACSANEALGCSYAEKPQAQTAAQVCEAGQVLGCATVLALDPEAAADPGQWARVSASASSGCAANDGRACSVQAWTRCAVEDACDADAVALAERAAKLLPTPEVIETLAIVQCRAGQAEAANATLANSCTAGNGDACQRSCETLRGQALLVRADKREQFEAITLYAALNLETVPGWYAACSAMDAEQLTGFEHVLSKFIPPVTEAGAAATVPAELREQSPEIVEALLRSPQVDAKKITYWIKRLPNMPEDQRVNLLESLRKQWWIIPSDPDQTPQRFVDHVRLRSGGLSPAWVRD